MVSAGKFVHSISNLFMYVYVYVGVCIYET